MKGTRISGDSWNAALLFARVRRGRDSKPATTKTILVLDGDVLVRIPVVQLLRECGYRVLEAASTDEAIAILGKTAIPVDVVLSEIDIPGSMNGVGFAQWARSIRPVLKILLAGTPERAVQKVAQRQQRCSQAP